MTFLGSNRSSAALCRRLGAGVSDLRMCAASDERPVRLQSRSGARSACGDRGADARRPRPAGPAQTARDDRRGTGRRRSDLAADALIDPGEPVWDGSSCTALVLEPDDLGEVTLPEPMDPVTLLRAVDHRQRGGMGTAQGVDALREAWAEAGIDVASVTRSAASL